MIKTLISKLNAVNIINGFKRNLNQYRTHYCNELSLNDVGKEVTICGWLKAVRFNRFLLIKDSYAVIQVQVPDELNAKINELTSESVIKVSGLVRGRPKGQENLELVTGKIEIECKSFEVVNKCKATLPFPLNDTTRVNETTRLKYRYLDLRIPVMHENIKFRSNFVTSVRQFLNENRFLDIETPTLFRRTPGGAREFLVPTRNDKKFYCLTQSPQQFKQLLMCAGFDKYYQIARCYRDEELKADRQPEFTQIDIEMSFINEDNCIELIESMLAKCLPLKERGVAVPFRRMKFEDAIRHYGIDKPDLRFDMKFSCLTEAFTSAGKCGIDRIDSITQEKSAFGFKVPLNLILEKNELLKYDKLDKLLREMTSGKVTFKDCTLLFVDNANEKGGSRLVSKFMTKEFHAQLLHQLNAQPDEMAVVLVSKKENEMNLLELLGQFRLGLADYIDNLNTARPGKTKFNLLRDPNKLEFLWVVDFPLFTFNEETKRYESTHHPFTAPKTEQIEALLANKCDLSQVRGQHYDLVLNGSEIAGGSIRIHDGKLQRYILKEILNEDTSLLEHLIEALEYGAPPHGGIAIGLDRLMAIMCKTSSIRDVIAFPKSSSGRDLMSDAPSVVPKVDLDFYKIQLKD